MTWPSRIVVLIVVAPLLVSGWALWKSRADTADARECGDWASKAIDAYDRAETSEQKAAALTAADGARPSACDRLRP